MLIVGGGAYALATSSSGEITVCVNHKDGTLYKAAKCDSHDTKLSWSQIGPRGATGPRGIRGPRGVQGRRGVQGLRGPSTGFANGGFGIGIAVASPTTVASKSVPAGSYVITAKVDLENLAAGARDVNCKIADPSQLDLTGAQLSANNTTGWIENIPLQATITVANTTTVSLDCQQLGGSANDTQAIEGLLTLVQVGSLQ